MRVSALVPAHNEAGRIAETVRAALSIDGVERVLVIDDGSDDETASRAAAAGADVLRLPANVGKGGALETGAEEVRDADVILLLDADLGQTASEGALLLDAVVKGHADMAVAVFPPPAVRGGFGLVKGTARRGISWLGDRRFVSEAPLSGQRALTADCLAAVRPFAPGYGAEVALTVRALRNGCRVVEVPTTMAHAATGRDLAGFTHRGRQLADVFSTLMSLVAEGRRSPGGPSGR